MHINQLNIHNLTSLWKKYGADVVTSEKNSRLMASKSWPYRAWVEGKPNLELQLKHTPQTHRLSTWFDVTKDNENADALEQLKKHWQVEFEQIAMSIPLSSYQKPETQHPNFVIERVTNPVQLNDWLVISSEAFKYNIDEKVFTPLLHDTDIEIYIGKVDGKPALSAMLFKTENVTGLHQMGVSKAFQGQGLAKKTMHFLLNRAKQQSEYMVLQASEMGLPLYRSLGFEPLFELTYFKAK